VLANDLDVPTFTVEVDVDMLISLFNVIIWVDESRKESGRGRGGGCLAGA
jgi:hypothetical protein